ncbi:cysteine hydrolase family protein [Chloroflexota bacterium]
MGWREQLKKMPILRPDFELDAGSTALVIVDMTYMDAHPDCGAGAEFKNYPQMGSYYFGRLEELVIPNHRRLIDFFHRHGLNVIYLTVGCWMTDKSDLPFLFHRIKKHMGPPDDKMSQVLDEIKPQQGDLVIHKSSSGAFNSTSLEQMLRNLNITSLAVTGVATPFCVDTTARDAADKGFKVVIVDDACATHTQPMHDAALLAFSMVYGRVLSTDEVLSELVKGLNSSR